MPMKFIQYLDEENLYICKECGTHLTALSQLISQAFRGQTGTAYLFDKVVNVMCGEEEEKILLTGLHKVCDIYCIKCNNNRPIGWKYIQAIQQQQKYKEGKFILELEYIKKENWTDD